MKLYQWYQELFAAGQISKERYEQGLAQEATQLEMDLAEIRALQQVLTERE